MANITQTYVVKFKGRIRRKFFAQMCIAILEKIYRKNINYVYFVTEN